MSTKADLKENILASKLEVALTWLLENKNTALTGVGLVVAGILISSVFVIRARETWNTNYTRLGQAQSFISQQQFEQADQLLADLASKSNDQALLMSVFYYRGLASLGLKNFDQAAQNFQNAADKAGSSPLHPLALANLGFSLEQKKDFLGAAGIYGRFMAEYGDHFMAPRIQLSLGRCLFYAGKNDESKKALDQLIDLYPTSAWAENARTFLDKNKTR